MRLNELKPSPGSLHRKKRVGRGVGSGHGKTSGRGHKGQKARAGGTLRPGFEGGQTPLFRRIPKRGFPSHARYRYAIMNLDDINALEGDVTVQHLVKAGFLKNDKEKIKILGGGKIEKPITVQAHAFSKSAKEKIEKVGGKAVTI